MTIRHEIVESPSETGARSREAWLAPPGSSEEGAPSSGGFLQGGWPLVRVGEAGFWAEPTRKRGILEQDVDRPSGEPARVDAVKHAARFVVAANPRLQ